MPAKQTKKTKNNKKNQQKGGQAPFSGPQKNIVKAIPRNYPVTADAKKYSYALQEPFSEAAIGARVPDQYFCPTVTYAVREFLTIKADTNGEADVVICPNPAFVAWSSRQSIQNGTNLRMKNGTDYSTSQYTNNTMFLANKLSNYRVVSWGVRVRSTQAINTAQGTVTAALFVPKDRLLFPSAGAVAATSVGSQFQSGGTPFLTHTLANYITDAGLPLSGADKIDLGSLVDFPYHMRATCVGNAENTYEISPKLTSPSALHFRDTADSIFGSETTSQWASVAITDMRSGDSSYLLMDGWTNVVIGCSGLVVNSTGALDLEIVYNIEGNPALGGGGTPAIAVATGAKSVHDPIGALLAQAALEVAPAFKYVAAARTAFRAFSGAIN